LKPLSPQEIVEQFTQVNKGITKKGKRNDMKTNIGKLIGLAGLGIACLFEHRGYTQVVTPCLVPPDGITAWYQAESNTVDSVNANNGTFNGTTAYASGEVNNAFSFNGASYVQVPDSTTLHFTNNVMTVETWIYLTSYTGANSREIVSKLNAANLLENVFTMAVDPSNHKAYYAVEAADYGSSGLVYSSVVIPTNEWTHIAATCDGSAMNIYVNGQLSGTTAWTNGIFQGTAPLTIGCTMQSVPTSYFNGRIDELSLYQRALTDCEIQALYLVGPQGKCH
jgi:hypothetical protein